MNRESRHDARSEAAPPRLDQMVLSALFVFAPSCGLCGFTTRVIRMPPAWLTFEFCQYAETGRNLAVDGTFDIRLVEPMALAMIEQDYVATRSDRRPMVDRYP